MEVIKGRYQISGPSAFNFHGFHHQVPNRIYVYNNRIFGEKEIGGVAFVFIKTDVKRLGSTKRLKTADGIDTIMVTQSRALVDAVYDWSRYNTLPRAYAWILQTLKKEAATGENLIGDTLRYGNKGTIKRTDFYRLSENLDFMIAMPPKASVSMRRKRMAPLKEWVGKISSKLNIMTFPEDFKGHNSSRQYIAHVTYPSIFLTEEPARIKIEIGLREMPLMPPLRMKAKTLLINPFTRKPLVAEINLTALTMQEAFSEKLRAALTRLEPAIRDFFDIDYLDSRKKLNLKNRQTFQLLIDKLKVPGNPPVDLSPARKDQLKVQVSDLLFEDWAA